MYMLFDHFFFDNFYVYLKKQKALQERDLQLDKDMNVMSPYLATKKEGPSRELASELNETSISISKKQEIFQQRDY